MAAPAGGAAAPSADGGRPLGQQEAQLAEHATKLLSLPLLSIGQLPCRLRDATVEQIVRMYADCTAQQARAEAHGCAARQRLMEDVSKWCTWALSQALWPQDPAAPLSTPPQKRRRKEPGDEAEEGPCPSRRGADETGPVLEGAREMLAHFGVGALDWASMLAVEGATALARYLPQCDATTLSMIALEGLPALGHPDALPAIEELVVHCCRTALQEEISDDPLSTMLPLVFRAALLAEGSCGESEAVQRPFDSLRSRTKLLWWRLRHADFSAEVIELARQACASYPYGCAPHMIIEVCHGDRTDKVAGAVAAAAAAGDDAGSPGTQRSLAPSLLLRRVQAVAECSVSWTPMLEHAVDVLLQLLHDTGHPGVAALLDAFVAAHAAASQNQPGRPLVLPAGPRRLGGRWFGQSTDRQRTAALDLLSAMTRDPHPCKTWQQLLSQHQHQHQQVDGEEHTAAAAADPLCFMQNNQPGLVKSFAWAAAGCLHTALAGSAAHRLAEAAVSWLGWHLSATVPDAAVRTSDDGNQEGRGSRSRSQQQLRANAAYTADLVKRALSGPDSEQEDSASVLEPLPLSLQAYGWLARSRYLPLTTASDLCPVSFTSAVDALLKQCSGADPAAAAAAAESSGESCTGSDRCETSSTLPSVVAAAVLDLAQEWLNEGLAAAEAAAAAAAAATELEAVEVLSTDCAPYPVGFWTAVVEHLSESWVRAEPVEATAAATASQAQLQGNSALVLLRRMAAADAVAVVGSDGMSAAAATVASATSVRDESKRAGS
jgi:hypothetical protein